MTTHSPALVEDLPSVQSPPAAMSRAPWPWIGLGAVGLVAVLVFWAFEALPFQDLPAHAGLIAMRHRFEGSAFEQKFFVLAPHIGPYSLFRFLGEAFMRVGSPLAAVRVLGTLPVIATPLAMLFARRRLYAERSATYGYLGVTLSFGFMTLMGFASYLLGVAVMIVGLTLWLDLMVLVDDQPNAKVTRRRELIVAVFAPVMFVAHGHAFLLFLACAGLSAVAIGQRKARMLRFRALVPALMLAAWVAWVERGGPPPGSVQRYTEGLVPRFQTPFEKFELLVSPTLMTRSGIDFFAACVLLCFTVACAAYTVRSLRKNANAALTAEGRHTRALYLCALVMFSAFVVLPHAIGWFGFVDGRLLPVALMLALLGIRRDALSRPLALALHWLPPVLASTVAVLAMVASYRFQAEARGYKEVLAHIPAESRLLNLPLDPNSDVFTAHPFIHYDKLVLVERPIVVSDIWFHQGSALYPKPGNPVLRLPPSYSESNLKYIDWPAYHLEDWDYVLIRTRPEATEPAVPSRLVLEDHRGGWWLFRHRSEGS